MEFLTDHSKRGLLSSMILLLILYGCNSGNQAQEEGADTSDKFRSYQVNVDRAKVSFTDVFAEVELMQLEETESSLLNSVGRVSKFNNRLIFPGYNNGDVYIFSDRGDFLKKFNNTGEGEGQYSSIQDLWLDGASIVVYDGKKTLAHWYNEDGDHLKSLKMPTGTGHIYPFEGGYLTDMSFSPDTLGHKVWALAPDLTRTNKFVPYETRIMFPMGRNANSFSLYKDKLTFKAIYDDTTYFISSRETVPFLHVDFGEKYLWKDRSLMKDMMAVMKAIPEGKGVWNYTAYPGSEKIYMTYDISLKKLAALIDRETGEYHILNTFMKNEERYDLSPLFWDGDRMVFSMPSSNVSELLSGMKDGQWSFAHGATLETIESSENPVLMWVKFK